MGKSILLLSFGITYEMIWYLWYDMVNNQTPCVIMKVIANYDYSTCTVLSITLHLEMTITWSCYWLQSITFTDYYYPNPGSIWHWAADAVSVWLWAADPVLFVFDSTLVKLGVISTSWVGQASPDGILLSANGIAPDGCLLWLIYEDSFIISKGKYSNLGQNPTGHNPRKWKEGQNPTQ